MYPQTMPRNSWYMAAFRDEITREPFARTIQNIPLVFYRLQDGRAVALLDQCIHRQMPLSLGYIENDNIRCCYHGLVFGPNGQCVEIPSQESVPALAKVQTFQVVEQDGLLWIWIGDPEKADPANIPPCPWLNSPDWVGATGILHMNSRAQLLNENLLDLSHVEFLHPGSIGASKLSSFPITVDADEKSIRVTRIMDDIECPALFKKAMDLPDRIRRTQTAEWFAPGFHVTHIGASRVGADDEDQFRHKALHWVTPETDTSTHYFWALYRNYRLEDDEGLTQMLRDAHHAVFCQDVDACEAIELALQRYGQDSPPYVNIKVDNGSLKSRRQIESMLREENI